MKKLMLQITVMVITSVTVIFAQTYHMNDLVAADGCWWVDVVNPDPVLGGNGRFSFGESCVIDTNDKLRIIGNDETHYLLRVEKERLAYGTPCPNGILFFMDFSTVESMKRLNEKRKIAEAKKVAEKKKAINDETKKKVKRLVDKHAEKK